MVLRRLITTPIRVTLRLTCLRSSVSALVADSTAITELKVGSVTSRTLSLATQAIRVSALIEGGVSISTRSYEGSTLAKACSRFQSFLNEGLVPFAAVSLEWPTMTSSFPVCPLAQDETRIASDTVLCRGFLMTSAAVTSKSPTAPKPLLVLHCGSRSITKVRRPRCMAAEASPSVIVVLPTPPFKALMLNTCT